MRKDALAQRLAKNKQDRDEVTDAARALEQRRVALNHEHDALELELERINGGRPAKNDDETAGRLYASQHVPAVPWMVGAFGSCVRLF